jgi:hypothetical protein
VSSVPYPQYYNAAEHPEVVNLEPATYLTITGQGAPGGKLHLSSIEAIVTVASAIQESSEGAGAAFVMPKLEGQWWFDEDKPAAEVPRDRWHWKLMVRVPDSVTRSELAAARKGMTTRKRIPRTDEVVLETLHEGLSVQMLHLGSYDTEPESVARILAFMKAQGPAPNGRHHEIYLSDIRTGDPARARTILRYPVKKA